MIIVFSGTDGAGKSTQIKNLTDTFQAQGGSPLYLWSRGGYTPIFSAIKSLARKALNKKLPKQGNSNSRDKLLKKGSVSRLWLTIAIIDLIFLYGVYVRLQSLFGKTVICDRYIDDTAIDFKHNFTDSFNINSVLWRLLKLLTPRPHYSFLLYVPVNISQYRSTLKNEPFPDTKETLEFRLANYLDESLFPSDRYKKIQCEESIDNIHQLIVKEIAEINKNNI
jgi:dTMP kinase